MLQIASFHIHDTNVIRAGSGLRDHDGMSLWTKV